MSSAQSQSPLNLGYDRSLLAATPAVSKAAKQEGYNVDLLEQPRPARETPMSRSDPELGRPKEYYTLNSPNGGAGKTPFWRTRGGIITFAVLAILAVGAIVGGAVGGTVGKSSKGGVKGADTEPTTGGTSNSTSSQGSSNSSASSAGGADSSKGQVVTPSTTSDSSAPTTFQFVSLIVD